MIDNDDARERILEAARISADGRKKLPCAKAFALSAELGIPLKRIGEICEREGIKIAECQLGCFR